MKLLLIAAICIALVASVPVAEVPAKAETAAPVAAPAPAAEAAAPAPAATEASAEVKKTETEVKKTETEVKKTETETEVKKTEAVAEVKKTETETEVKKTETETKKAETEAAAPQVEEVLKQVVNLVQSMTGGMSEQDSKSLKDMMSMGADILTQAEKKAQEIQSKIQDQNLLQSDNMFGIKEDGSIDAGQAVDQITNLINVFVGPNTVNDEEKKMMKSMLTVVTSIINPTASSSSSSANGASAIAPMAHEFESILRTLMTVPKAAEGKHDDLVHPESLIDMLGAGASEDKNGFDFSALSELTNKFFDSIDKAAQTQA